MNDWDKNPGILISEIKMMEASAKNYYWLIEGPSDLRFFTPRRPDNIQLIISGGKRNVIDTINKLSNDTIIKKLLGIVDADIDWLLEEPERHPNIITTDPRDIEGLLIRSSAYKKVLAEFADPAKIRAFEFSKNCDIKDYIKTTASFFGKIRAVNDLTNKVSLKKFKPQSFMRKDEWKYDLDSAIHSAVNKGVSASSEELYERIKKLPTADCWHYVRGHDAINIFTGGLVTEIGRGGHVDASRIESVLRAGIDEAEYKETKLFKELSTWVNTNIDGK